MQPHTISTIVTSVCATPVIGDVSVVSWSRNERLIFNIQKKCRQVIVLSLLILHHNAHTTLLLQCTFMCTFEPFKANLRKPKVCTCRSISTFSIFPIHVHVQTHVCIRKFTSFLWHCQERLLSFILVNLSKQLQEIIVCALYCSILESIHVHSYGIVGVASQKGNLLRTCIQLQHSFLLYF